MRVANAQPNDPRPVQHGGGVELAKSAKAAGLHSQMTPGLSSMGVGSNWSRNTRSEPPSVLALEPTVALSDGCNGLTARSLKLASNRANRHTLKAAPAAAILVSESGATG